MLITASSPTVYINDEVSLVCEVALAEEVDTHVRVQTQWNTPSPPNNRIRNRDGINSPLVFRSILTINTVAFSDAGVYTCIASVYPSTHDETAVSGVPWITQGLNIVVCKSCCALCCIMLENTLINLFMKC